LKIEKREPENIAVGLVPACLHNSEGDITNKSSLI